jgi:hypothetical protein
MIYYFIIILYHKYLSAGFKHSSINVINPKLSKDSCEVDSVLQCLQKIFNISSTVENEFSFEFNTGKYPFAVLNGLFVTFVFNEILLNLA